MDKRREKGKGTYKFIQKDISFRFLGSMGEWLSKRYIFTVVASGLVTLFLVWSALQITFDHNYMNVEPEGLTSIALMDTVLKKFDLSIEYALILADDVNQSREFSEKCRDLSSVAIAEDITLYLPSKEQQKKRIPYIDEIRKKVQSSRIKKSILPRELPVLIKEIKRLEMNLIEIQDMAFLGGQDKVDNKCKKIVGDPDNINSKNINKFFFFLSKK